MQGYVAVEGVNGVGKSTFLNSLRKRLDLSGITDVWYTREIGGCEEAEKIRSYLTRNTKLSPQGREALIWTARTQLARFIKNNHADKLVVSDRCWVSTYVYNSTDLESALGRVNTLKASYPLPDVYVLLDAPVDAIIGRLRKRSESSRNGKECRIPTPFDKTEEDEILVAQEKYREIFLNPPTNAVGGKWVVIDTTHGLDEAVESVYREVKRIRDENIQNR